MRLTTPTPDLIDIDIDIDTEPGVPVCARTCARRVALTAAMFALVAAGPACGAGNVSVSLQGPSIYDEGRVFDSGPERSTSRAPARPTAGGGAAARAPSSPRPRTS